MNVVLMIFERVINVVERVMMVQRADVLTSRKEAATDARCLLIWILSDDLTDGEIAKTTGLTRQAVNGIRNSARNRIKNRRLLQQAEQEIRNELAKE